MPSPSPSPSPGQCRICNHQASKFFPLYNQKARDSSEHSFSPFPPFSIWFSRRNHEEHFRHRRYNDALTSMVEIVDETLAETGGHVVHRGASTVRIPVATPLDRPTLGDAETTVPVLHETLTLSEFRDLDVTVLALTLESPTLKLETRSSFTDAALASLPHPDLLIRHAVDDVVHTMARQLASS